MAGIHRARPHLIAESVPDRAVMAGVFILAVTGGLLPAVGVTPLVIPFIAGLAILAVTVVVDHRFLIYALVPAYFLPLGFLPEVLVSVLIVGPTIGALFLSVASRCVDLPRGPMRVAVMLVGLDLVWSLAAITWAQDATAARQTMVQYVLSGAIVFLIVTRITDRHSLDRLMTAIALGGWGLVVSSIAVILRNGVTAGVRFQVFDTNENQFTLLLTLGALGVLWPAVTRPPQRRGWPIVASFAYLGLAGLLIAASGSRGGLLSIAVLLVLLAPFRATRRWGLLGVVGGLSSVLVAPAAYATVLSRFLSPDEAISRTTLAQGAGRLIADRPMFGAGLGNGPFELVPYLRPLVQTDVLGQSDSYPAHNPFLEVAADAGMIGLLIYAGLFGTALFCLVGAIQVARRDRGELLMAYVVLTSTVSFAYGISWIKSGGVSHGPTFFLILALWILAPRVPGIALEQRRSHTT